MTIKLNYSMSKMNLAGNETIPASEIRKYADDKISRAVSVFDTHRDIIGSVVMKTEGVNGRMVQKITITLNVLGQTIRQSSYSRSMKRAIDKAVRSLERQVLKLKTRTVEEPRNANMGAGHGNGSGTAVLAS